MKVGEAFPSKWLSATDLGEGADTIVTIDGVEIESLGQGKDSEDKPVLSFIELDKGLVVNKTNAGAITAALGTDEMDDWIGKKISLYVTEVQFKERMVDAIRVRSRSPKSSGKSMNKPAAVKKPAPIAAEPEDGGEDDDSVPF